MPEMTTSAQISVKKYSAKCNNILNNIFVNNI